MLLPLCALRTNAAELSARCAVVYEPRTGTVLYARQENMPMLVASTTKILTAMVVLEHCALSEPVTVTEAHCEVEGSSAWLNPGADYTVEDLLYGMMLNSGNDAAAALADHCGGSMEGFAALMNEKCAALGLERSHFVNSHGLDDPEHYSTALDLARITTAAMEDPVFCKLFSARGYSCHGVDYVNHNKLLDSCPGCIGGKTGYTQASGRVLVSCAEREGMRLIVVTICDPDDWIDHAALYDEMFAAYRYQPLPGSDWQRMSLLSGTKSHAALRCTVPGVVVPKDAQIDLTVRLPRFAFAPVYEGVQLGTAEVRADGALPCGTEIFAAEQVDLDPAVALTAWERFKRMWFLLGRSQGVYYGVG